MFLQVVGSKGGKKQRTLNAPGKKRKQTQTILKFLVAQGHNCQCCCSSYFCLKNMWKVVKVTGVSLTKAL